MYIEKPITSGYNAYLTPGRDFGTGMDVGLLVLEAGQRHAFHEPGKELAALLLSGAVAFEWDDRNAPARRGDCFRERAWCLHMCRDTALVITASARAELYIQAVENPNVFDSRLYAPPDIMIQHAGGSGELGGCMEREIRTVFDYESAPWSHMVLGEVLNLPGKWSSYPPHHHPQPEVYFHRFDRPQAFGASFIGGEVYTSRHNGLSVITSGSHPQAAAPGYAMCYVWGIRHLPGDPWRKTRIDDPEHAWLLNAD